MTDWYYVFLACVLILWLVSTPRDRNALRIVLIASLASEVIVDGITQHIQGAWKLVIPGALEILTILALLKWARNRTGITQAGLLVFAWLAHVLCYLDIALKTDLVYSRYETILFWVSAGQLVTCYDTMRFNLVRIYTAANFCWSDCDFSFPRASHGAAVSRVAAGKNLSPTEGECATIQNAALMSK